MSQQAATSGSGVEDTFFSDGQRAREGEGLDQLGGVASHGGGDLRDTRGQTATATQSGDFGTQGGVRSSGGSRASADGDVHEGAIRALVGHATVGGGVTDVGDQVVVEQAVLEGTSDAGNAKTRNFAEDVGVEERLNVAVAVTQHDFGVRSES